MKPDEIKRFDPAGIGQGHSVVFAADHDRVVAELTAEVAEWRGLYEHGLTDRNELRAVLKGPGNATQKQLDFATKPLHAEIEALTERLRTAAELLSDCAGHFKHLRDNNVFVWPHHPIAEQALADGSATNRGAEPT